MTFRIPGTALLLQRSLFILCVFIIPIAYVLYQALWDESSSFLPFERRAGWAFHPVQEIEDAFHKPVSQPVRFGLEFWMQEVPPPGRRFTLQFRAFRTVREISLNGEKVDFEEPSSWKESRLAELNTRLQRGQNILEVLVANPEGIPGLMVEEPSLLRTPGRWTAVFEADGSDTRNVVGARQMGPPEPLDHLVGRDPGPFPLWLSRMHMTKLVPVWLVVWSGASVLATIQMWRRKAKTKPAVRRSPSRYAGVAAALVISSGLLLNMSNAARYPAESSPFDFQEHVQYIEYISKSGWIAEAKQGFQMYQPPLYYWFAACVEDGNGTSLRAVQYIGALAGWILGLVSWLLARRLIPSSPASHLVAAMFAVCLPMVIYMSPLVTNEVFAAAMIAIAFYWLVRISSDSEAPWKILAAGLLAGLAMLSKYPALFVLIAGCFWLSQQWLLRMNRQRLRAIVIYAGAALSVCGWLYTRNLIQYGDPFVMAGDEASGFWYVQQPTYRTVSFYASFGSAFFHHPERAPWISFGDGHYASLWADLFRTFLQAGNERAYFWVGVVLLLGFAPSCAILLGFLRSLRAYWRRPFGNRELILLSVSVWTFWALVSYSIQLPFVSVIKAFFFLFLVPVLSVYLSRGRLVIYGLLRPLGWLHDASFLLVCAISVWLYVYPAG